MKELASQALSLLSQLVPLLAVYLGWHLANRSERRRHASELLERRFEAFRQMKAVTDNIPRETTVDELKARFKDEPTLLQNLGSRLVRLFGLRRELVPYLDDRMGSYIDQELGSLYRAETGTYEMQPGVEDRFARCCVELVTEINRIEKQLVELHRKSAN